MVIEFVTAALAVWSCFLMVVCLKVDSRRRDAIALRDYYIDLQKQTQERATKRLSEKTEVNSVLKSFQEDHSKLKNDYNKMVEANKILRKKDEAWGLAAGRLVDECHKLIAVNYGWKLVDERQDNNFGASDQPSDSGN